MDKIETDEGPSTQKHGLGYQNTVDDSSSTSPTNNESVSRRRVKCALKKLGLSTFDFNFPLYIGLDSFWFS